jgi:hypothetical protein
MSLDGCGFEIGEQLHVLQDMLDKKCDNGDYELCNFAKC